MAGELAGRRREELSPLPGHALAQVHDEEHRDRQVSERHQPDVPLDASVEQLEVLGGQARDRAVPLSDDHIHQHLLDGNPETDLTGLGGGHGREQE